MMSTSSSSSFVDVGVPLDSSGKPCDLDLKEPIAIVGLGCRLPANISSLGDFWEILIQGRTGQGEVPPSRFNVDGFYHPDKNRPGSMNMRGGYFIKEDIRQFENTFFGINNLEATYMDPQQRKLLEVAYECFESAGARLEDLSGSNTGVYVGNFTMDFQVMQTRDPEYLHRYSATGMGTTILSNRISHVFNLVGPSLVLDTACSSSLYCLHMAVMALRNHECDAAIAAGVNLIQSPEQHIGTMKAGVLSPTSTSHAFSDQADGYGRADGVGAVYIKRLSDALANGDPIRAVIRGSAVNANGHTPGITQPSSAGQEAVIRKAHAQAGLDLNDTAYVEAHGTGTPVGDPIEMRALAQAFSGRPKNMPLLVGSVKTNLGHSEAASGISSLIKVVLALERRIIPPTVNVGTLNPDIKAYDWNLEIVTQSKPWPSDGSARPRRAGINSFGYGGANVHLVLEAADEYLPPRACAPPIASGILALIQKRCILPFSASTPAALDARVADLNGQTFNLLDLAYTLTSRRSLLPMRGFLVSSQQDLADGVSPDGLARASDVSLSPDTEFTFVFTGQGAQWSGMGKGLLQQFAVFRQCIHQLDTFLQALDCPPSWTLIDTLSQSAEKSQINEASRAQPACTALQIAILDLLKTWGVIPTAVLGHSSGEIAAAYAAGLVSARDAIIIAYYRGQVVSELQCVGQMMAIGLGLDAAQILLTQHGLRDQVAVACVNSPENITLSGDSDAIDQLDTALAKTGLFHRKLATDKRAYHSHHMATIGAKYERLLREQCGTSVRKNGPRAHWISSVTTEIMTNPPNLAYWRQNLEQPVCFAPALQKLAETHPSPLIEIGPHAALSLPIRQTIHSQTPYFSVITRGEPSDVGLLKAMGHLYVAGAPIPLNRINGLDNMPAAGDLARVGRSVTNLPKYSWTYEQDLWHECRASAEFRNRHFTRHELLGSRIPGSSPTHSIWRNIISAADVPWLQDHRLESTIVFPAAGYVAMAVEALGQTLPDRTADVAFELKQVHIKAALTLPAADNPQPSVELFTVLQPRTGWWSFEIASMQDGQATSHAHGSIRVQVSPSNITVGSLLDIRLADSEPTAVRSWYHKMREEGLNFGPQFQTIQTLHIPRDRTARWAVAEIPYRQQIPGAIAEDDKYLIHPTTLDGMFQTAIIAGAHGVIPALLAQVPIFFDHAVIRAAPKDEIYYDPFWRAQASSQATGFATATIVTELYRPGKMLHAQVHGMQLRTYEAAAHGLVTEENRQPMLRVNWQPDISAGQATPDSLTPFLAKLAPSATEIMALAALVCHKNPRTRILYILQSEVDRAAAASCLQYLNLHALLPAYSQFTVLERGADQKIIYRTVQEGASMDQTLANPPDEKADVSYDLIIMSPIDIGLAIMAGIPELLEPYGLLVSEESESVVLDATRAYQVGGLTVLQKLPVESPHVGSIDCIVIVERTEGSSEALGNALVALGGLLAKRITRLPLDAVSEHTIPTRCTVLAVLECHEPFLSTMDATQMARLQILTDAAADVLWITAGGLLEGANPEMALVSGLARSLMLEQPSLRFFTLDHDPRSDPERTAEHIAYILDQSSSSATLDYEFLAAEGLLWISRFVPEYAANTQFQQAQKAQHVQRPLKEISHARLAVQSRHATQKLVFQQEVESSSLASDAIEVRVYAQGVSAADAAAVQGTVQTLHATYASQFTGFVTAVGAAVTGFAPGDPVAVWAPTPFRLVEHVPAWACQKLPGPDSLLEVANILAPYGTAYYVVHDRSALQPGERILVHGADSQIGYSIVRLALLVGAEVFCTVTSHEASEALVAALGLPSLRVIMQRDAIEMGPEFLAAIDTDGVDVLVNLQSSPSLDSILSVCASCARLVDLSPSSSSVTDLPGLARQQVSYMAVDMERLFYTRRPSIQRKWTHIMAAVLRLFNAQQISFGEQLRVFSASDLAEAYEVAYTSLNTPVTIFLGDLQAPINVLPLPYTSTLSPNKMYFLVGCLGGLGASLAKWMFARGARQFLFQGRTGTDRPAAQRLVDDLTALGANVIVVRGDVSSSIDVQKAIDSIPSSLPLGGVIQAAMGLSEALFSRMTHAAWNTGIGPKVRGTWNIQRAIAPREASHPLDFFLLTSSVSGSVGTATESNYCAANHFLDRFARYRRARNQTAISVGLGMISEVGYLHENPEIEELLLRKGIQPLDEGELLQIIDIGLSRTPSTGDCSFADPLAAAHILTGLEPIALKNLRSKGFDVSNPTMSDPRAALLARSIEGLDGKSSSQSLGSVSTELQQALDKAQEGTPFGDTIAVLVTTKFCNMILVPLERLNVASPLSTYGMDSMLAADFRSWLWRVFKVDVPFLDLLSPTMSLGGLVEGIEKNIVMND